MSGGGIKFRPTSLGTSHRLVPRALGPNNAAKSIPPSLLAALQGFTGAPGLAARLRPVGYRSLERRFFQLTARRFRRLARMLVKAESIAYN